jgi:mRNA interferase MazF
MPAPGDVLFIPFPYTDLTTRKRRPVLVLNQADSFGDFLAAAITSQTGHDDALPLNQADFLEGTLPKPSYLRGTKLYTLNTHLVIGRFGALTPNAFARMHAGVCTLLGCVS